MPHRGVFFNKYGSGMVFSAVAPVVFNGTVKQVLTHVSPPFLILGLGA